MAAAPILVCYDGSEGAKAALETAAVVFGGSHAVVACYWQPFAQSKERFAVEILELVQDADRINRREEELAARIAAEGAGLAADRGLHAEPQAIRIDEPVADAILSHADELGAATIVLGARSGSSLRRILLGDVTNEVAQRATRPVFVVPSRSLADRRRRSVGPESINAGFD